MRARSPHDCGGWGRLTAVRLTDFWDRMDQVFGPSYARSWAHDHVITALGGLTVDEAIEHGIDTVEIWRAVHADLQLPASER